MSTVLTRDELCRFLEERFGLEASSLGDDDRLFSEGLLDSFSMVELITFLESRVGGRIGVMDVQLDNLDSIARILRFVWQRSDAEAPS